MSELRGGNGLRPLPRLVLAAGIALVVIVIIPGLANPFIVPKESLVALVSAFAVLILVADRRPTVARWPRWWTAVLAAPLAVISVAALLNGADLLASDGPLRWWIYALFFVALRLASRRRDGEWLERFLAVLGGVEGALVTAQVLAGELVFDFAALPSAKWRAFGTLGNPNWVGGFLAVTLPLALARRDAASASGDRRARWGSSLMAGAIVTGLVLTFSRGAWVAAAAGVALLALLRRDLAWRRVAATCAAAAALAGSIAWLRFGGDEVGAALGRRGSVEGRARMWAVSASMIAARPFTGWGPGRFAAAYPPFQRDYLRARGESAVTDLTDHPHNEYLHLAAEAGVPALLAFLGVLGLALWKGMAASVPRGTGSAAAPAAAALVALAVHACVDTTFRLPATAAVFCALLVTVFVNAAEESGAGRRPLLALERAALAVLAVLAILQATRLLVVDRALAGARRALASGDAAQAQQVAEEALRLDASHAELWAVLALASQQSGDEPGALAAAARARALRPSPENVYLLADLERGRGRSVRAIAELRDLSETVPGLLLPRVLLGEALAEDGQIEAARGVLTAVLTMRSKLPSPNEQALQERAARVLRTLPAHD